MLYVRYRLPLTTILHTASSSLAKEKARLSALQSTLDALDKQRIQLKKATESASATLDSIAKSSTVSTDLEDLVLTAKEADLSDTKQQIANIR